MRRRSAVFIACAATIGVPAIAHGQQRNDTTATAAMPAAVATSVDEVGLFRRWLRSSLEVESWRTQIGAANFDVVTARLLPNPQISLNTLITVAGTPPDGQFNLGGQVTFPLPIFGQIGARVRAADAALSVAQVRVVESLWERAGDIQSAMVERAFADARVHMFERNLEEISRIERVIASRVSAGANSRYDVLRVQTSIATIQAALAGARIARDQAEAHLVAWIVDPGLRAAPITRDGLAAFRGPEDIAALLDLAMHRRPDLELARRGIVASGAVANRYRVEAVPVPSVWVGGYYTHEQESASVQAGVSFNLPVFDRNQGQIGRAVAEGRGQELLADALSGRIRAEVSGAWAARAAARQALEAFRAGGLATTTELLQRAEVSYREGAFTIMDLLDAYRSVWEARTQEIDLQRAFADAEAELERASALITLQ